LNIFSFFGGIRGKLLLAFLPLTILSLILLGLISYFITSNLITSMSRKELDEICNGIFNTAKISYEIYQENVNHNINLVDDYLNYKVELDKRNLVEFKAINQITKQEVKIEIPVMKLNGKPITKDTYLVDKITSMLGGTVTIFQLIPQGMLRISTSVKTLDGKRAIGTFIPKDSPVYKAIESRKSYSGRAFVVDNWYITTYKPLYDKNKELVGAIYVGINQANLDLLRNKVNSIKIGKTGYPYILDSKGNIIIHPSLENTNLYDAKDSKGKYFVREICEKKDGEIIYDWKNVGDVFPRKKIARFKYISEMDWIVVAGSYLEEFYKPLNMLRNLVFVIVLTITSISIFILTFVSVTISKPIIKVSENLFVSSNQLESAATQVSSSSQELSSGASELASSVEEITSSMEELQSIIESNTKTVNEAEILMKETSENTVNSAKQIEELQKAMNLINENAKKIVKINKVIDDIAFQTSILALNAAVEAARAGEAGRGFSVVADQVKSLAQKSAEAAKETTDLIDSVVESINAGQERLNFVKESAVKVSELANKVNILLDEITTAFKEQSKGASQVTKAISQVNTVVQGTAASSEETASAGEELLTQVEQLRDGIFVLNSIVYGLKNAEKQKKEADKKIVKMDVKKEGFAKKAHEVRMEVEAIRKTNERKEEGEVEIVKPEEKIPLDDFKEF